MLSENVSEFKDRNLNISEVSGDIIHYQIEIEDIR
jgi:hypothetical protein